MIKLNLLPSYVIEARRIRTVIVVFIVLLGIEGGLIFKAYTDMQAQEAWFKADKEYYVKRKQTIDASVAAATAWKGNSGAYATYNSFFTRDAVIEYNNKIALCLEEAAELVGGGKAWFTSLNISKDELTVTGKINGLMNFVNYYFRMSDAGLLVVPAAQPAASPNKPTLGQQVPLSISGKLKKNAVPEPPGLPDTPELPSDLYKQAGSTPAPGAAPAAGAPAAGAPAAGAPAAGAPAPGAPAP